MAHASTPNSPGVQTPGEKVVVQNTMDIVNSISGTSTGMTFMNALYAGKFFPKERFVHFAAINCNLPDSLFSIVHCVLAKLHDDPSRTNEFINIFEAVTEMFIISAKMREELKQEEKSDNDSNYQSVERRIKMFENNTGNTDPHHAGSKFEKFTDKVILRKKPFKRMSSVDDTKFRDSTDKDTDKRKSLPVEYSARHSKYHIQVKEHSTPFVKSLHGIKEDHAYLAKTPIADQGADCHDVENQHRHGKIETWRYQIPPIKREVMLICTGGSTSSFDEDLVTPVSRLHQINLSKQETFTRHAENVLLDNENALIQYKISKDSGCKMSNVITHSTRRVNHKQWYYEEVEKFMKEKRDCDGVLIWYTGYSHAKTGNWCFKDGYITFNDIFELYNRHLKGKVLTIISDCSYSGQWLKDCVKVLDEKSILSCGHHCKKNDIQIKVICSCQENEMATTLAFINAVQVQDGHIWFYPLRSLQSGQTTAMRGDFTMICCGSRDVDPSKCEIKEGFNCNWEERLFTDLSLIYLIVGCKGFDSLDCFWYYILVDKDKHDLFRERLQRENIDIALFGEILYSGKGHEPDEQTQHNMKLRFQYQVVTSR